MVVFDDIQWGEETFLDLIEHVALLSSGAAILLLCMARPELAERRPTWPVTLRLEPLGDDDVDELIPERIPGELREKIARAAGGNPLFIEEMLAMAGEAEGEVVVPPTLQALLAARLDQLEPAERSVLERGAIEGEIFHRGAVQALAPDETQVTPRLAALVRKELIRPDRPQLAGEDGFRFRHLLIRDAAYDALPKATRAELHERFAAWLEEHGAELVELDEILGYHLEQACRYRAELGLPDDDELAAAARRRLTAGGRRAALRQDYGAAVSLLERAAALVPPAELDLVLETELVDALFWAGKADEALRRADSLAERASAAGDRVGELCGRIQAGDVPHRPRAGGRDREAGRARRAGAARVRGRRRRPGPVHRLLRARGGGGHARRRWTRRWRRTSGPSPTLGRRATAARVRRWRAPAARFFGTTPVSELLAWLDENEPRRGRDHFLRAYRAGALAMLGRFDEARAILAEARAELAERGGGILLANVTASSPSDVELLAGDPAAAAEFGAEGCRLLEELGEQGFLSTAAGNLAQALYALDRLDEADAWAGRAAELGASDDAVDADALAAGQGEGARAPRRARRGGAARARGGRDRRRDRLLDAQGDAYADLAEVLLLAGKPDEAAAALEQALERYERKGNLASAGRTRTRLRELELAG